MAIDKEAIKRQIADLEKAYKDLKRKYRFQHVYSYDKPEYERLEREILDGIEEAKRLLRSL